jgi:Fe-S-cluster containining protein
MTGYIPSWITDNIAVGSAPMSYADLDDIREVGIDAIVNLCAEFSDLHELETDHGFEVCYLPVWDEEAPEMDKLEKALEWLDEAVYLGKKVLVHCRHGIGRTGTFVISYMIRRGLEIKAASKKLKKSRANPSNYGQWKLLKAYKKQSGRLTIRQPSLEVKNRVDLNPFFKEYEALITSIDNQAGKLREKKEKKCGKGLDPCCMTTFKMHLVEVVYLSTRINRQFSSTERQEMISRTADLKKKRVITCPMSQDSGCRIFKIRPARCRIYGIRGMDNETSEISKMLFELSQAVFLSFSGSFLTSEEFTFSMADTILGKYVETYFSYMAKNQDRLSPT